MDNNERKKYLQAYYQNEFDANKQMTLICAIAAGILVFMWVFYLTGAFVLSQHSLFLANIAFPISFVLLLSPLLFLHTSLREKKGYKYYLMGTFLLALSLLNVIVPKHMVLGWAIPIILVNHYYNPKMGRITFAVTLFLMLICLYMGMFFGEYDPYLLMGENNSADGTIICFDLNKVFPDTPEGRFDMLHQLKEAGQNRYLTALIYYYFGRVALLTVVFFASNSLNKRTFKLFVDEFKVNAKQEKINNDLSIAKDIQQSSLPFGYYCSPSYEICAELKAAKEVGGDFYQYLPLDDDHIAVAIGDVSGKGIPAAMFMMKTLTTLKNFLSLDLTPSQILNKVNASLYESNENQIFVTCFLGIIDLKRHVMIYCNAGHNQPIFGFDHKYSYLPCAHGFILGIMPQIHLVDEYLPIHEEESLLLYTDGITEARDGSGRFFGEDRLLRFMNEGDFSCPLQLSRDLLDEVADYANGAEQSDDITHLLIKITDTSKIHVEEKTVEAEKENIAPLLHFMEEFARQEGFPEKFTNNLMIIGDELISNIIKYAYEDKGDIFIRLMKDEKVFVLTIIDQGKPFNALEQEGAKLEGEAENQPIGGLGLFMVKNMMDNITYDYRNKKNILILRKSVSSIMEK